MNTATKWFVDVVPVKVKVKPSFEKLLQVVKLLDGLLRVLPTSLFTTQCTHSGANFQRPTRLLGGLDHQTHV